MNMAANVQSRGATRCRLGEDEPFILEAGALALWLY
jgi:hypothetical protein